MTFDNLIYRNPQETNKIGRNSNGRQWLQLKTGLVVIATDANGYNYKTGMVVIATDANGYNYKTGLVVITTDANGYYKTVTGIFHKETNTLQQGTAIKW